MESFFGRSLLTRRRFQQSPPPNTQKKKHTEKWFILHGNACNFVPLFGCDLVFLFDVYVFFFTFPYGFSCVFLFTRYLYLSREDYELMSGKGAVNCEEVVDEASGETRFKILVRCICLVHHHGVSLCL